jgi:hypothetical protein
MPKPKPISKYNGLKPHFPPYRELTKEIDKTYVSMSNSIKRLHKSTDKDVVIFCCGPSLLKANPEDFDGMLKFSVNFAYEKMPSDYVFIHEIETYDRISKARGTPGLILPLGMNHHRSKKRRLLTNKLSLFYKMIINHPPMDKRSLDLDIDSTMFSDSATTHSAIHVAAYMGAKKIYLVGVDYKNHDNGLPHFKCSDEIYSSQGPRGDKNRPMKSFRKADDWLKKNLKEQHGIELINLSDKYLGKP